MNPALLVKLRASSPWRIGPDSGARNRVESIFHSDALYSAVTQAMSRLGFLDLWLGATARSAEPAVCFSSCFPLSGDTLFVTPPRTVWPPGAASLASGRVRWKSARFVPLEIVHHILAGKTLNEDRWILDGASGCLIDAGKQGPFRSSLRWSAAIDRLTGAAERHASACLEFRPGAGLWTLASFVSPAARDVWQPRVEAAFRWLADSGFGGERSRGWGRAESPEFTAGELPSLLMPMAPAQSASGPDVVIPPLQEPPQEQPPVQEPTPEPELPQPDPEPVPEPGPDAPVPEPEPIPASAEAAPAEEPTVTTTPAPVSADAELRAPNAGLPLEAAPAVSPEPQPPTPDPIVLPPPSEPVADRPAPHWLLSLFSPAPNDTVDWTRGNYQLINRGGRIESSAGAGALKKQLRMIAEGSVLYSASMLRGAAPDVAPEGFAHPVFRAGFAVAVPLPEAS